MRAIQSYLPNPRHTEVMRIFVQAPPTLAWETVRSLDLSTVSWIRFLFDLRTIADLFHQGAEKKKTDRRIGIDQITSHESGFKLLYEQPGKEIVVGAIGKFWHMQIPFADIKPQEFSAFSEAGWGKVAWCLMVDPFENGSTIGLELRTSATDEESWHKLNRYYHLIGFFSHLIRRTGMKKFERDLKPLMTATDEHKWMPGDEAMKGAKYVITDRIDIEAPPAIVWKYLMQLGCDRGGWYSIDLLDHGGVKSTDHIVDIWRDRAVGDRIAATPKLDSFFEVLEVCKDHHFVIGGKTKTENGVFKMSWTFALEPIGDDATRLSVRARMIMSSKFKEWFMGTIFYPPVHGLMELVQLRTIKHYAERDALERTKTNLKNAADKKTTITMKVIGKQQITDKSQS